MSTGHVSRREFVGASAGAAALLASGRSALGANEKVRLALIGAGNRGNDVMKAFLTNKEVEFVAAADVDERHASETAAKMKEARGVDAKAVKDYRELTLDNDQTVSDVVFRGLNEGPIRLAIGHGDQIGRAHV